MLLSALLLAAAVQAAPASAAPAPALDARPVPAAQHRGCPQGDVTFTLEKKERADPVRPLAREPRARGTYAVMRSIDGCPVDTPMTVSRRK